MIEALVRMKATLTRDSHPARRAVEPSQPETGQAPRRQTAPRRPEAREVV